MTPNDTQMDVLMRRYAKHAAERGVNTEHLDADELNAFAEGTVPSATRSRYVSHLADCVDCRRLASQLALGAGAEVQIPASEPSGATSWWQKLNIFQAPSALRYAAFAVVLVAVAGIALVVWRQPRQTNSNLIAQNEPVASPVSAVKPSGTDSTRSTEGAQFHDSGPKASPQSAPGSSLDLRGYELSPVSPPPPPRPEKEAAGSEAKSAAATERGMGLPRAASSPSFAPQPPVETYGADSKAPEQKGVVIGGAVPSGPRRNESYDKFKVADRARSGDLAKDRDENRSRAANQATISETKPDDSTTRAGRESGVVALKSRSRQEMKVETRKASEETDRPKSEAEQLRSVGGRKFRHQGNAWVDTKFKTSMSVRNIARGSDEFGALDSGLRSIAQQLSGEIVVVWKGKAYRIR
jgi:hypothetical protein